MITNFTMLIGGFSSQIGKFLLNILLLPAILTMILYAFMKPIIIGMLIFISLCVLSMFSIYIFKKLLIKNSPKGD